MLRRTRSSRATTKEPTYNSAASTTPTTPTKGSLAPFVFRPFITTNTTSAALNQVVNEAAATNHEPINNRHVDHALVMFDNNRTADKNLIGSWSALMNLGRKGDAEKIRQIGIDICGEKDFNDAISATIALNSGISPAEEEVAAAGFARVEVATELQDPSGDDRETAKKCLATAAQAFRDTYKRYVADQVEEVFKNAFGKTSEE